MRGLKIILLTPDAERFRGALTVAAAHAALGGRAALFLQLDAVAMLKAPVAGPGDEAHRRAGLPALDALVEDAVALGVTITACQSGLMLAGMNAADLAAHVETSGPVAFLQQIEDDDRLLVI